MQVQFKCSRCGCEYLDEVMVNVTVHSEIDEINDDDTRFVYGTTTSESGEVSHYSCRKCGHVVVGKDGSTPKDEESLVAAIKEKK